MLVERTSEPEQPAPESDALFLDFDGTLVEIAERPDAVILSAAMRDTLQLLQQRFEGAVAIVSGRPVVELDLFLTPLRFPLAGVHGLEIRQADGSLQRYAYDRDRLETIAASIRAFAAPWRGLLVEAKAGAVALHYRKRPDLEADVRNFAHACASAEPGLELVHGKMVAELRLGGRSKADAVSHFMSQPPFAGRTPWFFGDDVTDEDGFRRVNELGGRSVKIGSGQTCAHNRFDDIAGFHRWLSRFARQGDRRLHAGERRAGA